MKIPHIFSFPHFLKSLGGLLFPLPPPPHGTAPAVNDANEQFQFRKSKIGQFARKSSVFIWGEKKKKKTQCAVHPGAVH